MAGSRLPHEVIALTRGGRGRPAAFAALAQASRLDIFRLLVRCVPDGATSGEVARRLSFRHNVVSSQLRVLVRAGLVTVRQERGAVQFHAKPDAQRILFDLRADS